MALFDELLPTSIDGVSFLSPRYVLTGGRKNVIHEFPNSDNRFFEDLGLLNKSFTIPGITTGTGSQYKVNRDSLKLVLDAEGEHTLSHTFLGIIQIHITTWTLEEDITILGEARFTINCIVSQQPILPTIKTSNISDVLGFVNQAITLVKTSIIQVISITKSDNFIDALNKTNALLNIFSTLGRQVVFLSDENSQEFFDNLRDFSLNTATILNDVSILSTSIENIFVSFDDSIATPRSSIASFENFYDFGDDDTGLDVVETFELLERDDTREKLNATMQTMALLMSYRNIPQVNFLTDEDVNEQRQKLDDQFEKILEFGIINQIDKTALFNIRNLIRVFLDEQAKIAYKIEEIEVNETSITELVYRFYGDLDNYENIINLNQFKNLSHIEGTIKILTK